MNNKTSKNCIWYGLSTPVVRFLKKLLKENVNERATIEEIESDPWLEDLEEERENWLVLLK